MDKKFDGEYFTQYVQEMKYLESVGINYTFVKNICGVTTYKYKKNANLFHYLEIFYKNK